MELAKKEEGRRERYIEGKVKVGYEKKRGSQLALSQKDDEHFYYYC